MFRHRRLFSIMYDILSLTNSTLLSADMILLCTKNLYPIHDSHSSFRKKMFIHLQVLCHRPSISPPALPLNLTYILIVPSKRSLGSPTLYKLLTFHNPNLISIFRPLGHLSKQSIQVQGCIAFFATNSFFYVEGLLVPPQPPSWRTTPL
jgi:hypothetical protein